jgi:hypothetical protein
MIVSEAVAVALVAVRLSRVIQFVVFKSVYAVNAG